MSMAKSLIQIEQESAFRQLVESAVAQARSASLEATARFIERCRETGHVTDGAGMAVLWVYKPTYRLRRALKSQNAIERYHSGYWSIDGVSVAERGWGAALWEVGCEAALKVFELTLPDDGIYSIHSWTN